MSSQTFNAEVVDVIFRERDQLKVENAALRELINILAFCINDEAHDCDKCAINGADTHVTVPEWLFCDSLIERLRTLGFEVSE